MQKIILLLVVLLFSISAFSQNITEGSLYAVGKKGEAIGTCPLKSTRVKADISGFLARVTVVQEFENNLNQPIEAVYTFPLSQNSAVDNMTMKVGERTIRGRIMKRDEARQVYEAAKIEGKTASLLDQERPNIFTQSIANILPNEKIIIEISYVETLNYEDGAYQFVFPMTVGPRYIPGSVQDANKISPPVAATRAGHNISIEVNLDAGVPVEEIRSGSHKIKTLNLSPNNAKISLKDEETIPNKDFVLRYDVTGKRIEDAILTHRDERGGFFTMILQPPDKISSEDITPKEIVFVLDTSGSMEGFPIEKAKEAMKMSLDGLNPNDTFNLITFAGDTAILFDEPVPATRANLEKAQEFLESRKGGGGTEMMKAIKAALEPSDSQEHLRIVCFMTDGYIGNENEIIAEIQKHPKARVFSFGIGNSVNRFLLDKMAQEGRGEVEYVSLQDDGSKAAKKFYERVRTPLLTDISIDWNGLPVADVYPNTLSDLFSAKPVILHGRYTKGASGTIKLKGKVAGQDYVREILVNLPETESKHDVLATLWARTRIDELMTKNYIAAQDDKTRSEAQNAITNIGLEFRLLTQFTSFVAVENKIKTQGGQPTKVDVPVEKPAGMSTAVVQVTSDSEVTIDQSSTKLDTNITKQVVENLPSGTTFASVLKVSPNVRPEALGGGFGNGSGSGSGNGNGDVSQIDGASSSENTFVIDGQEAVLEVTNLDIAKRQSEELNPQNKARKTVSGGVINGKAVSLPKPVYPQAAKAVRASGAVNVQVMIDENGNVVAASAVSGHPLLRKAAETAASQAKFAPAVIGGKAVKITGVIVYNFVGEKSEVQTSIIKMRVKPLTAEEKRIAKLAEKLHSWIFALVERLQKGVTTAAPDEANFVSDGKAEIQIQLKAISPEVLKKLKNAGFEMTGKKDAQIVTGRIPVGKLVGLAEIAEVQYILPNVK
ncbi:MAG: TonB family protein [Pyrinomonadaceae bacterium]